MIETKNRVADDIRTLLSSQPLAVLATQGDGQPYTSLMAYAYTQDLSVIVVATPLATRKHRNIVGESRVSLLVDDRCNDEVDFQKGLALTIVGEASEVAENEREFYSDLYIKRHPTLSDFLLQPSTVFFKIEVQNYLLVSSFQEVVEYKIESEPIER